MTLPVYQLGLVHGYVVLFAIPMTLLAALLLLLPARVWRDRRIVVALALVTLLAVSAPFLYADDDNGVVISTPSVCKSDIWFLFPECWL
jgi:hypothetical protein